jgi:tight adherence protein B
MTLGVIFILASFIAAFLGVFTINLVLVDVYRGDRKNVAVRINQEMMEQQKLRAKESAQSRSSIDDFEEVLKRAASDSQERKSLIQRLDETIHQSGQRLTKTRLFTNTAMAALAGAAITLLITHSSIAAAVVGGMFGTIPLMLLSFARRRRMNKLLSQLPDALELMSRVLRAGQSITQGIQSVSEEFQPPICVEFGYCYEQQNLGLAPEVALHELSQRTGLLEMRIFVLAVLVHKQSGGNLTTMLDSISKVVRERFRLRLEIKGLTAEGRLQAIALLSMPIVMWIGLFFIQREYAFKLFDHPSLVIATATSMFFGALWIRKVVNFDF